MNTASRFLSVIWEKIVIAKTLTSELKAIGDAFASLVSTPQTVLA
jgi:hypothetical protein